MSNKEIVENINETTPSEKKEKKPSIFKNRKFRYGTTATIFTVIVVVAVILLNVVFSVLDTKYPLNIDLTKNKLLTLSNESKDYAKNIKKDINITICSKEDVFTSPSTGYTELDSVLSQYYSAMQQYKSLSKGKVNFSFVDLTTDVAASAKLSKYNLSTGSILYQCGDRYAVSTVEDLYSHDDNYETYLQYKAYGQDYTGEYSFNSLVERSIMLNINQITGAKLQPITLLTGHDEDSNVVSALTKLFENNGYEVLTKDITTVEEFDENTNFAVLPAPSTDYSSDELKTLREWVQNDGKLGHQLMYVVDFKGFLPNLAEYFNDNYGIEVTPNWVVETATNRLFSYYVQYTYGDVGNTQYTSDKDKWVKSPVTFQLINHWTEDSGESKFNQAVINFPSSAQLLNVHAYEEWEKAANDGEEMDLEQVKADKYPISGMSYSVSAKTVDGNVAYSNALVCGSSLYFSQFLEDSAASNEDTFMSVFNGLTGNEHNVTVASKSLVSESLDFGSEATKKAVGLGLFTIGLPVILLVIAVIVFVRRKNL